MARRTQVGGAAVETALPFRRKLRVDLVGKPGRASLRVKLWGSGAFYVPVEAIPSLVDLLRDSLSDDCRRTVGDVSVRWGGILRGRYRIRIKRRRSKVRFNFKGSAVSSISWWSQSYSVNAAFELIRILEAFLNDSLCEKHLGQPGTRPKRPPEIRFTKAGRDLDAIT